MRRTKSHRADVGRDFGASRDAAAVALQRVRGPPGLLLTNDSVPRLFLPMARLVDTCHAMLGSIWAGKASHTRQRPNACTGSPQLYQRGSLLPGTLQPMPSFMVRMGGRDGLPLSKDGTYPPHSSQTPRL